MYEGKQIKRAKQTNKTLTFINFEMQSIRIQGPFQSTE